MRARIHHIDFYGPRPNACEATIPAPTAEHRDRIRTVIREFGCEVKSEAATSWTFQGVWPSFKQLLSALDKTVPWFPEGDRWGLYSTFVERALRFPVGFACWVIEERGERVRVLGQLLDGRWVRAWVKASRVDERQVLWLPVELRQRCASWATREEAMKASRQKGRRPGLQVKTGGTGSAKETSMQKRPPHLASVISSDHANIGAISSPSLPQARMT